MGRRRFHPLVTSQLANRYPIFHTVTNNGPAVATGVRAVIEADNAMVAVSSQGTCQIMNPYTSWWTCDLGELSNGQSVSIQVEQLDVTSTRVMPVDRKSVV